MAKREHHQNLKVERTPRPARLVFVVKGIKRLMIFNGEHCALIGRAGMLLMQDNRKEEHFLPARIKGAGGEFHSLLIGYEEEDESSII